MEVIRKLDLNDLEQIISLRIEIQNYDLRYVESNKNILNEEELIQKTKEYIENNLDKNLYMFGIFKDDELIANCGFYLDRHFPTYQNPTGMIAYICNVYTKEEYREKGYQGKVFQVCLNYARKINIKLFKLSSLNEKAINMYESFGFERKNNVFSLEVKS